MSQPDGTVEPVIVQTTEYKFEGPNGAPSLADLKGVPSSSSAIHDEVAASARSVLKLVCNVDLHPVTFVTLAENHVYERLHKRKTWSTFSNLLTFPTGGSRIMTTSSENRQKSKLPGMHTPPIVPRQEWEAAWE
ncbi:MAG TPA: hypothetical protein VNQ14_03435, partial [Woeseiaceae bacterium]|nr:hypothetical protein [Woeseiaceae bacterium]